MKPLTTACLTLALAFWAIAGTWYYHDIGGLAGALVGLLAPPLVVGIMWLGFKLFDRPERRY